MGVPALRLNTTTFLAEALRESFAQDPDFNIHTHARRAFGALQNQEQVGEVVWRFDPRAADMATWFCDAYASWQKGGIENANGRLRRWLPRQTNIDNLANEDLQEIIMTYNLTPRKCLGYLTPIQALFHELGRDVRLRFA